MHNSNNPFGRSLLSVPTARIEKKRSRVVELLVLASLHRKGNADWAFLDSVLHVWARTARCVCVFACVCGVAGWCTRDVSSGVPLLGRRKLEVVSCCHGVAADGGRFRGRPRSPARSAAPWASSSWARCSASSPPVPGVRAARRRPTPCSFVICSLACAASSPVGVPILEHDGWRQSSKQNSGSGSGILYFSAWLSSGKRATILHFFIFARCGLPESRTRELGSNAANF